MSPDETALPVGGAALDTGRHQRRLLVLTPGYRDAEAVQDRVLGFE